MRRVPRPLVAGFLLTLAVTGVAGCRTSPNVAAYVGDEQISVAELESAVDDRLQDEDIAAAAEGNEDDLNRLVLSLLVEQEVYQEVADRYGVRIDDDDVRDRIEVLFEGQDPDTVYADLAQQGLTRADVFENVRQLLVRVRIAEDEGLGDAASEEALRARYEQVREGEAEQELGLIVVPDQATADSVLGQLTSPRTRRPTRPSPPSTPVSSRSLRWTAARPRRCRRRSPSRSPPRSPTPASSSRSRRVVRSSSSSSVPPPSRPSRSCALTWSRRPSPPSPTPRPSWSTRCARTSTSP
jgi:hypothetical protein